ncbi:DUF2147 domain-containing protein [Frigoriflavimonas asaccharolytica]|uniref:Uncharacterized protein (DUF2147 family) n=1 Tax=Frigoriflavimonas asaccharolytica TaxID=2735899 RepID=A0A8J8K6R4_9FLAO|nr:DUF2147 domain-containing protein [Frigoriflavimonas asaccharolytica]NRS91233.1 uncharacterized protein (DUF2147 family) [Frigoriflavimonas asaccharolytica]
MLKIFSFSLVFLSIYNFAQVGSDAILGKWISTDKNVAVNVYKEGNSFQAKIIWFDDTLGSGKPMNTQVDSENPNPQLRNRKILGMDVLENLSYNGSKNRWENGKIYDASSGRTWDSFAEMLSNGYLKVRGFWKFKWIGKTLTFKKL